MLCTAWCMDLSQIVFYRRSFSVDQQKRAFWIHVCSSVPSICFITQQNSFNPMSVNLALDESSPTIRSSAFYQKRSSSVKQANLKDIIRKASKSVNQLLWYLLNPWLLLLQVLCSLQLLKTPETQEDPDDPESVGEEISNRSTPVIDVQPQSRSTKKNYL